MTTVLLLKEFVSTREAKMLSITHWRGKALVLGFFQKGHIYDQIEFHSNLNTVLDLPLAGTEWMSVASLPWDISKSKRLLISPHLFSVIVENWLSRGGLRQRSVIIRRRRRNHSLLEQVLPEFPPLTLARPVLWRAHQYFTFIFMCVIWRMLFHLWSISANCLKCLHRLQPQLAEVPGTKLFKECLHVARNCSLF